MKNLFNSLSVIGLLFSIGLNAQTSKTTSSAQDVQVDMSDSKSRYIQNQDYLSKSTLKDFSNVYGDSLKGFKEADVKAELLANLYYGEEFTFLMNFRKREYINNKYKIGPDFVKKPKVNLPPTFTPKNIGSVNTVNALPCINEDFEQTVPGNYMNQANAVTGWTVESTVSTGKTLSCNTPVVVPWIGGSPEFAIVSTPILNHPYIGTIPNSPLGGNRVAVLNNTITPSTVVTRLSTSFPVTQANTVLQFAYAGSWDGSGHNCCDQPFFNINMYDCNGTPLGCSSITLTPPGPNCNSVVNPTTYSTTNGVSWTNWKIRYIDLTPYIGTCVTLRVVNGDCNASGHHGMLYFDAKCGGQVICQTCTTPGSVTSVAGPVSFCAGSGQAQISAPVGYASYSWTAPPPTTISAAQSTLSSILVNNPIAGSVFTVNLVSPSGCLFTALTTVVFSTVNIAAIGSAPSCIGGASGQATVVGNGSGTGYNYTWLNSSNVTVGTNSVVTGLAAGVYSVVISGFGAAGCGSAVATTTVDNAPPGVINFLKPYCGTTAFITTPGGTNYQWYNNTTPISQANGGNSGTLNIPGPGVAGPNTGQTIILTYLSNLGCQDSVKYTLAATPPGNVTPFGVTQVCPGASNGSVTLNITPAQGAPQGLMSILVGSTGTTTPFTMNSGPNNITSHNLTGLSAGTYSVKASDGSCNYLSQFVITTHLFDFSVTPVVQPTVCSGTALQIAAVFQPQPSLLQYSYSWSPNSFMVGANAQNAIITPVVAAGTQSTFVYAITATPSVINCPITKTLSVLVVNPAVPTITAIPDLCNTANPYQIITNPGGGVFSTGIAGINNPVTAGGLINPALATIGAPNNFTVTNIVLGCSASNTLSFNVSQFWSAGLTANVPPLCVTNPQFNLMNIVQNAQSGSWSGIGTINGTHFNPSTLLTGTYAVTYSTLSTPNPNVCPDFTTHIIAVTNTILPSLTPKAEFCTNEVPFNLSASPAGGNWLPVAGVFTTGLVTPASFPNNINTQVVTYTVADGPCLNTNTMALQITHYNPATLTAPINPLCFNSQNVNLMTIAQNQTGIWSGIGVSANTFFPQNFQQTSVVTLTYVVASSPNPTLCVSANTINVSVTRPIMPSITQVGPFCNNGSPVQLTAVPAIDGHWTASAYLSTSGVFNPSMTIVGNNPIEYVVGTNTCHVEQIIQINIEAFVPAAIANQLPDLCNTSPAINLSPFTISNLGTWSGSGIVGTSFNPALTGSGNFMLTHSTNSYPNGLCPDVASIAVNVYSLAAPIVNTEPSICSNTPPFKLKVSPVGGLFGGSVPGAVDLGGLFNPGLAIVGNNIINYSITSGPCTAYAQTVVKVQEFVEASFLKTAGPFCKGDNAFNMNSIVTNTDGQWLSSPGMLANMFNPSLASSAVSTLTYMTFSSPIRTLCVDQGTINVEVRENPVSKINTPAESGCMPFTVSYNSMNANAGFGTWTVNDGSEAVDNLFLNHTFTSPGIYDVQFDYKDEVGCVAEAIHRKITVHALPKADFSVPDEILITDPKVQITNLSNVLGDNKYQWKITGLEPNSELNPVIVFPKIGKYTINLTATTINDCKDEITKTVDVKNHFNIFFPNSFTPNFDGLNDVFIPVYTKEGLDLRSFEMEIFDRWGHTLYRTKDITKGWDGSNKGEPMKEEVYLYRIKYKDSEGNAYDKTGHVALVK